MKLATIGQDDVHVDNRTIAAVVALLGAILPVVNAITTGLINRFTETSKAAVEKLNAETQWQKAEMQRLQIALSMADAKEREQSIHLLVNARLLRDFDGSVGRLKAVDLPRWPLPIELPTAPVTPSASGTTPSKPASDIGGAGKAPGSLN